MKESYSSKKFHEELCKIMYDFMALICGLKMECGQILIQRMAQLSYCL